RRDGDDWRFDEGDEDYADREKVDDLLKTLDRLRAKSFVEEAPASLAPFGLALPNAVVPLEAKGVSQTALPGARAQARARKEVAGEIYAKRGDRPNVVMVEDAVTAEIVWDADHWRSKQLLHLGAAPDLVESIEVRPAAGAKGPEVRLVHEGPG